MKCPCCEQDLPERTDLLFSDTWRAVIRWGICVELTPLQYKIIKAVRRRQLTIPELADVVYSDRADGGPSGAERTVHVGMCQLNKRLKRIGIRVGGTLIARCGPRAPNRIINLERAA